MNQKQIEEAKAGRILADVVETTADGMGIMRRDGLFQEYHSPEARHYPEELKPKGKNGFFYLPNRETYNSLGFNTKLIPPDSAPRSLRDLLDPRWKSKMAITSTTTGIRWIGNALDTMGREYLNKMAQQDASVQNMAPAALINPVASGEVPLSPTIFDANVTLAKQKGAPVEWRPLEPVVTTVGSVALLARAANPHASLVFIDYLLSKEEQQLIMRRAVVAPRGYRRDRAEIQEELHGCGNNCCASFSFENADCTFAGLRGAGPVVTTAERPAPGSSHSLPALRNVCAGGNLCQSPSTASRSLDERMP